jgi:hypothetical protein
VREGSAMFPTPKSYDFDYENFEDFLLLDADERRWLVDNGIAPYYWYDPLDHIDEMGDGF